MTRVHLDHNATTPLRPEAREVLLDTLDRLQGNPSSVHTAGRAARALLDDARERTAAALGVGEDEVLFTSGGTESNNLALLGTLRPRGPGAALVTTTAEHSSVLRPAERLERAGHPVLRAPVDDAARPDLEALLEGAQGAALVSVGAANNEVGTVTPLAHLAASLAERYGARRPLLHTDGVQALGRVPLALAEWGIDLASFSAHKVGGPVGSGVLVIRAGTGIEGVQVGGSQEAGLRAGTENVAAAAAGALAMELAVAERKEYAERTRRLTSSLWQEVRAALPDACLLGPPIDSDERLPNTLNVLLPGVDGRVLVTRLDLEGLEASAGSACASGSLEPSHVLLAMGLDSEHARSGLRVSLGRTTTDGDIHIAVGILSRTFSGAPKSR